ncbi:hypothetical protein HMPREF9318_00219 [Streptococcus urinalis FB127-CNA-2]|uniref:Ribosomal processing cysteine protease Prp n=1 Tax=Streptococcus urinalis 2285-97 TaxID=764291 RepID=G5KFB9_9STRE|nr:ribosomal-processing cysteine protease Prp [Streptococcus urinalis]EHJ57780.1 hypothetical protein STRUR_0960 [Streptococcus urinalis 2285-97]EKS22021.1 hypothetical protein HMPREF9318_00219 [Streptococcus urinalis FB127-CNA-2]VEF31833.1 hypothetical ribosome-associated protein [Streptococcus urinalis]
MIKATFTRDDNNHLTSVNITGHAGSGEYGFDIVCASVSTLAINFVNSLEVLLDCPYDLDINEIEGGYMNISILQGNNGEKVQLLFESFLLGMTNLAQNSSEFVKTKVI